MRRHLSFHVVNSFRGIAILFVLLGHVNGLFYNSFGYDWFHISSWRRTGGVDFFFVVSGFMIYYLYAAKAGSGQTARRFLVKRWIRIYPLYFLFTVFTVLMLFEFPWLGEPQEREPLMILKSLFLWPSEPILSVTWSLQYIVFFYLVFACFMAQPRIMKGIVAAWMVLLISAEAGFIEEWNAFLLSFSHFEILTGCVVAMIFSRVPVKGVVSFYVTAAGILGYLAVWINNIYQVFTIQEPHFYLLFSVLIMLGIAALDKEKERRVPPLLSFIGRASYSIYIAHGPIAQLYIFLIKKLGLSQVIGHFASMSAVIVLTIITSCWIYIKIEKPLLKRMRGVRIPSILIPAGDQAVLKKH